MGTCDRYPVRVVGELKQWVNLPEIVSLTALAEATRTQLFPTNLSSWTAIRRNGSVTEQIIDLFNLYGHWHVVVPARSAEAYFLMWRLKPVFHTST